MAKLSAHGAELLRVELLAARLAYISDGKILRDTGSGWKLYKHFKAGVDIPAAIAARRQHYATPPATHYWREELRRKFTAEFPGLEHRIRACTAFDMLGDDIDGIWSELEEAGIGTDLDTVKELRGLFRLADTERSEEKKAREVNATAALASAPLIAQP